MAHNFTSQPLPLCLGFSIHITSPQCLGTDLALLFILSKSRQVALKGHNCLQPNVSSTTKAFDASVLFQVMICYKELEELYYWRKKRLPSGIKFKAGAHLWQSLSSPLTPPTGKWASLDKGRGANGPQSQSHAGEADPEQTLVPVAAAGFSPLTLQSTERVLYML